MKKLLSICFLSIVLVLAGFTSRVQAQNCCFWLENMQPKTLQDISNLGIEPGTAALLPGQGNELVLTNTLNYVGDPALYGPNPTSAQRYVSGSQTDWFTVHFGNCADPNALVSLEWILYENGNPISTENLRDYADIYIYTRYDQLANTDNVNPSCGHMGWLGGHMTKPGVCTEVHNNCAGGYPGALADVDNTYPYGFNGFISSGYTPISYYNFDAFRYSFLQNSETRIAINWKQIGNYSLVVRLRERTGGGAGVGQPGTDNFENLGANGTCCGQVLASDSLHYLVTTSSQKAVCDGSTYEYGNPMAIYSVEGQYNVLFGEYTCDHWEIDHIDALSFYTRINPDIVANNATICVNEPFTADDLAALAPAVETDAPGLIDYKIYWKKEGDATFTTTVPTPDFRTVGTTTYYVYQENHYDAVTGDDFTCSGAVDTITFKVLPVIAPILTCNENYQYCNESIDSISTLTLTAELNNNEENNCADHIHWFLGTSNTGRPVFDGLNYTLNLIDVYDNNNDKEVVYSAYSFDASTETYSTTGVSVTINFWKTPELRAERTTESYVVCPHTEDLELNSNFTSSNFNDDDLDWTFAWKKNGTSINTTDEDIIVVAPGCGETDTYTVTASVISEYGCVNEITRSFTVSGLDTVAPVLAWNNSFRTNIELEGCDFSVVPASMSLDELKENTKITDNCNNIVTVFNVVTDTVSYATCEKVLRRTYTVTDECGNVSNTISHTYTVTNHSIPTINGAVAELLPVRPLNNDCKSNLPVRTALLAAFHEHFTMTTGCDVAVADDDIHFFMGNTNDVADGNLDIFAQTAQVTVYAQITDACGNISVKAPVFVLNKPADLEIAHGAISTPVYELCNTETAHVVFDSIMIHNGLSPYVYTWSQTPVPAECGMTVADNGVEIDVWALNGGAFNTSAQFIMTVEDAYGCVTTDTSNAIRWFGIPDVTIIEAYNNDDYGHAAPVVVCPTFGHYLLTTVDHSNLPIAENQNLTYAWSGEAIDYTSTTKNSFIAVNENICDREYTATVEVTNAKGCKATASYSINVKDTVAPVITLNMPTDTITNMENCKIIVPDYTTLFNASTVSDECWTMDSIKVTQSIAAGTKLAENTDVVITVAPKCGPTAIYTIKACFPEPRIATEIIASVDSSCFPYTTNFTANTVNYTAPLKVYWDGAAVSADNKEFTTTSETAGLAHNVRVVDANGCEATDSYTLVVYHTPVAADVTVTSTPNHYCDAEHFDGSFTVTANNNEIVGARISGTTEWFALPYTMTVTNGTYNFDLRTIHDCVAENIASVVVAKDTVDANLALNLSIVTDNANCTAPWSGTIEVTNPAVGYEYHISEGLENCGGETIMYNTAMLNSVRFNFLYQGDYTVSVVSPFNCHNNAQISVADHRHIPELPTNTVVANTNCVNSNGMITLNNTNSDYWYTINGFEIRGNNGSIYFGPLSAGDYTLTVANNNTRCSNTMVITVPDSSDAPAMPTVTVNPNTYCVGSNGSIVITDPTSSLQYTLKDASQNVVPFSGLEAGTYTLTVFDPVTGCVSNGAYTINNAPVMPEFTATEVVTSPRTSCDVTLADGEINITEANGYAYVVKNSADEVVSNLSTLDSGVYVVYKTNLTTGCVASEEVHVGYEQPELKWSLSASKDLDCSEIGTGVITVSCDVPATFTAMNSNNEAVALTGLNPDTYTVTATVTATGCHYTKTVTVESDFTYPIINASATANYMCNTVKNGTITFNDVNTNANYDAVIYTVENDVVTSPMTALNSGSYTINAVTDYHCAAAPVMVEVKDSAFVITDFSVVPNSVCNPTASKPGNGQIRVLTPQSELCDYVFTDLTPTHHYDVDHFEPIDYTKYTLEDGWYLVQITDTRTGCVSKDSVYVPYQPIQVTIDALTSTPDYICTPGTGNGTINVHASSVSRASVLAYSIDGGITYNLTGSFANVEDGEYHIVVMDTVTRCIYDALEGADVNVEEDVYDIAVQFNNAPNTACDPALYNGEVHVSASYVDTTIATPNFRYEIEGNSFTGLSNGTYMVTITDDNTGCVYTRETEVELDNANEPSITVEAFNYKQILDSEEYHFCLGQTDGYMIASAVSPLATDSFNYQWSSSCDHIAPRDNWTNVYAVGQAFCCNYTVTVTSTRTGCFASKTVKVCVDTLPIIRFFGSDELRLISSTPTNTYEVCENKTFTFGIDNPGFQSIVWTNTHPSTDASFEIYADTLDSRLSSFCVKVVDNNGCASGPIAANIVKLPTATGAETIEGCGTVTFKGVTYTYTDAQHQYTVLDTLQAANSCDSVVTYTIVVKPLPTLTVDPNVASALAAAHCAGDTILATGLGYTTTYVDAANAGWRIISPNAVRAINAGDAFVPTVALTEEMNGNVVFAYAFNGCDTIFSEDFTLDVASAPTLDAQYKTLKDTVLCLNNNEIRFYNTYASHINWHNDNGDTHLQYSLNGGNWTNFVSGFIFRPTLENTYQIRFVATNRCGTDVVLDGPVTISAKDIVRINANTATQTICLGDSITPITVTVENADSVRFTGATGLVYENGAISGTPVASGTNSYSLTAYGACGDQVIRGSITVQDTVILNITNKTQTICLGESIDTIQINDVHALTSVEHYSLVGLLYGKYKGMTYDVSSLTNKRIFGTPTEAGTFTFTVTSIPANNTICQTSGKTDVITVTVKDTVRLQLNGNTNQVLCAGSPMTEVTYTAENATVTFANIADLDTVGNKLSGTHIGLEPVNYSVVAVSNNGCEATNKTLFGKITMKDTVTLALNPLAYQTICLGANIAPVATDYTNATCNVTFPQGSGLAYANDTITGKPLAAGTIVYTVSATSNNGCTSTNKTIVDSVVVNDTLKLAANVAPQPICLGNVIADINVDVQNGSVQSVTGLPEGVTFANNKISGTPTEFGTFNYAINAQSNCGCGSKTLNGSIVVKDTVKFTVADDATLTQTVCKDADITSIDFTVENATLTVQPALVAGLTLSNNSISGAPTVAGTYTYAVTATGECGTKSMTVSIKVNDVPVVTAITGGDTKVCEGDNFVKPTNPTVTENGATTTTAWLLDGEVFDWNTVATSDLNGKTVLFVATNACGADTASVTLTVDTIPVPSVSSDATTCLNTPVVLNATPGYASYQWFNGEEEIVGATDASYTFSSAVEGTYHFKVEVTDGNGCVSTETVNGSTDPRTFAVDNAVTVVVTSNPGFIFTHNGEKTHYFEATTNDPNTKYTWMVSNPCDYQRDKLVYVDFDIYFNGNLIDNDSIGEYIKTIDLDGNSLTEDYYVTSDSISWNTPTNYEEHYVTYYNYANHGLDGSYYSNHYPNGRMCGGTNNYQDLYLHFLTNRKVYKTINQFKRAGEYKIVYTLMATSNRNKFEDLYHNLDEDVIDTIGGQNPFTSAILTELATDAIIINVTGPDQVIDEDVIDNDEPAVVTTDERSMKIYPNPAINGSTINAEIVGISGNVVVRIVNLAGNTVAQESIVIPAGNQVYKYSTVLNNLPAGQYLIYVQGEENKARLTKKIVITK